MSLGYPFSREFVVSSPYGPRIHPITGEKGSHRGTDYATPIGTPIYSPLTGVIAFVGEDSRSGKYIGVKNQDYMVSFSHLSTPIGTAGDPVAQGQAIALSGNTGASTGPHVHVTVKDKNGNRIDPETVIFPPSEKEPLALAALGIGAALLL